MSGKSLKLDGPSDTTGQGIKGNSISVNFSTPLKPPYTIDFWTCMHVNNPSRKRSDIETGLEYRINDDNEGLESNLFCGLDFSEGGPYWGDVLSLDRWHHIAVVHDGFSCTCYIDGKYPICGNAIVTPKNTLSFDHGSFETASKTEKEWSILQEIKSFTIFDVGLFSPDANVYLENFRVSKAALWHSDFTPPIPKGYKGGNE